MEVRVSNSSSGIPTHSRCLKSITRAVNLAHTTAQAAAHNAAITAVTAKPPSDHAAITFKRSKGSIISILARSVAGVAHRHRRDTHAQITLPVGCQCGGFYCAVGGFQHPVAMCAGEVV